MQASLCVDSEKSLTVYVRTQLSSVSSVCPNAPLPQCCRMGLGTSSHIPLRRTCPHLLMGLLTQLLTHSVMDDKQHAVATMMSTGRLGTQLTSQHLTYPS